MLTMRKKKLKLILRSKKRYLDDKTTQSFDLTTVCYVFKPEYILKIKIIFKGNSGFVEIQN